MPRPDIEYRDPEPSVPLVDGENYVPNLPREYSRPASKMGDSSDPNNNSRQYFPSDHVNADEIFGKLDIDFDGQLSTAELRKAERGSTDENLRKVAKFLRENYSQVTKLNSGDNASHITNVDFRSLVSGVRTRRVETSEILGVDPKTLGTAIGVVGSLAIPVVAPYVYLGVGAACAVGTTAVSGIGMAGKAVLGCALWGPVAGGAAGAAVGYGVNRAYNWAANDLHNRSQEAMYRRWYGLSEDPSKTR